MQHHSLVTSTLAKTVRAAIAGFGLLVALAGLPVAAAGCGSAAEPALAAGDDAGTAVVATAAAQTSETGSATTGDAAASSDVAGLVEVAPPAPLSLHDRVMAEQGRDANAPSALDPSLPSTATVTTLVPADLQQPPTTTPGLPVPVTTSPTAGTPPATAPPVADPGSTTAVVLTDGRPHSAAYGAARPSSSPRSSRATSPCPASPCRRSELAGYYVRYCAEAGLRADLLWAQMALETGYGAYGGDVSP